MRRALSFLAVAVLLRVASAQVMRVGSVYSKLPQDLPQTFFVTTVVPPTAPVNVTVSSSSPSIVVSPTFFTIGQNLTTSIPVQIRGVSVTSGPVYVNVTTTSADLSFHTRGFYYQYEVFSSCGIVEYAPAECPPPGSWVYVQAELTKQNSANSNVYNVTLSGVTGFEVYLSTNVNCPSDSSYTGAVYLEGNYTRLDWLVDSPAVSFGSTSLPVRVGLKRNSDNLCTFSATVWDPTQVVGTASTLTCTAQAMLVTECEFTLLPWHIAVIVIGCVVVLAVIIIIAVVCKKRRDRKKKEEEEDEGL